MAYRPPDLSVAQHWSLGWSLRSLWPIPGLADTHWTVESLELKESDVSRHAWHTFALESPAFRYAWHTFALMQKTARHVWTSGIMGTTFKFVWHVTSEAVRGFRFAFHTFARVRQHGLFAWHTFALMQKVKRTVWTVWKKLRLPRSESDITKR